MAEDEVTPPEQAEEPVEAQPEQPPAEQSDEQSGEQSNPAPEPPPGRPGAEPSLEEIAAQISALPIGSFLLSTVSTLASIAYGKLAAGQLDDARGAIDAVRALLPVLDERIEPALKRDLEQALANLQVSYADASAKSSS